MRNQTIQQFGLTLLLGLLTSACGEVVDTQSSPEVIRSSPIETTAPTTDSSLPSQSGIDVSSSPRISSQPVRNSDLDRPAANPPATSNLDRPDSAIGSANTEILDAEEVHLEISLSRREVILYQGTTAVKSYPIGIGRAGWETPLGMFEVQQMRKDPVWIHPFTDERIPSGDAQNPLGTRWIGFWTDGHVWVGFHGTSDPSSVGTAASHGCIRMHNEDVEELFAQVELGTPVTVAQ